MSEERISRVYIIIKTLSNKSKLSYVVNNPSSGCKRPNCQFTKDAIQEHKRGERYKGKGKTI